MKSRKKLAAVLVLSVLTAVSWAAPACAGTIEVRVRLPGEQPAEGLRISLADEQGPYGNLHRYGLTDRDGRCTFTGMPVGTYALHFLGWPYRHLVHPEQNPFRPLDSLILIHDDDRLEVEVEGFPGIPVAVSVRPSDGEPKHFSAVFRNLETGRLYPARFDRAGDLERVLAQGRWEVAVGTGRGYLLQTVERDRLPVALSESKPPLGQSVVLDLEAEPFGTQLVWSYLAEARLTGRVFFEGERGGVQISATLVEPGASLLAAQSKGWETPGGVTSGLDQNDRFENVLPAGRWRVQPVSEWPMTSEPEAIEIELEPGETKDLQFTVRVVKGDLLRVLVREEDRRPIGGAVVEVAPRATEEDAEPAWVRTARTDGWGSAQVPGVTAGQGYRVVAGHPDFLEGEAVLDRFEPRVPGKSTIEVTLAPGATLLAAATDREGGAVADVEVTVERVDPLPPTRLRSEEVLAAKRHRVLTTDVVGYARAEGFYPGRHRVSAVVAGARGTAQRARVALPGQTPADEVEVNLELGPATEIEVWIEPAARFGMSLFCADGWTLPPSADVKVVPMTETGPLPDEPVLVREAAHLGGEHGDQIEVGPLSAGIFAAAVRPLGFRRWTWIYETHDPARAFPLPVERDDVKAGQVLELGPVAIECGPAVDLLPTVASGDPLPPLHEIEVDARVFDRESGAPLAGAPLATAATDRIELRKLPVGAVRLEVTLRHPHFLPTDTVTWQGEGDLERGSWLEVRPIVPAIGGSLRFRGPESPGALVRVTLPRRPGNPGEPEIRELPLVAGRAFFPSLAPGTVEVELCADAECDPPRAHWPEVEIVVGEEVSLTSRNGLPGEVLAETEELARSGRMRFERKFRRKNESGP